MTADIRIRDGRVVALGRAARGRDEIDARASWLPGGVDAHCHLDQPMRDGLTHGRRLPVRHALGGLRRHHHGDPLRRAVKGQSLRAAVAEYHGRAGGKAVVDYAFHLIVTDPTAAVLGEELPALIAEGYTSFKIYMTYET